MWPEGVCESHGDVHTVPPRRVPELQRLSGLKLCKSGQKHTELSLNTIKQNNFKNMNSSISAIILVMTVLSSDLKIETKTPNLLITGVLLCTTAHVHMGV